ncbi:MAG TPA: hypothetical protein VM734_26540 [Kofleriaceae bacterium]|nr:hypothetical protein [Kofleriaceae bacterium]
MRRATSKRVTIASVLLLAALSGRAWAQSVEEDRFFIDKDDEDEDKTLWQGSLTSSTFLFQESGGQGTALVPMGAAVDNASPYRRLFTDLRAQIDGLHLRGGRWDLRVDARARVVNDPPDAQATTQDNVLQSGAFGGNEYDVRDLYLVRTGRRTDFFVGRQTVADLGAIKIDGVRLDYAASTRWTYLGFAGLHPLRGSRSVLTDYPTVSNRGANPTRPTPVAGGFGGAYRTQRSYGAIGGVAIVTPQKDPVTGTFEKPRVYATASGYWRRTPAFDVYHYAVLDLYGSNGFALTNGTLGMQWKPTPRLRLNLSANRIDAEVLNIQVRDQFENADPIDGVIINNLEAQRIAADSLRATASAGLGNSNRFELTTGLSARRRPEVVFDLGAASTMDRVLPAAQAVEFLAQAVDRRFYGGFRLDLLYTRSVGIGASSYARSTGQLVRLGARKEIDDGRTEVQADVAYVSSADDDAGTMCLPSSLTSCYGSANSSGLQANMTGYRRINKDWFVTAMLGIASQKLVVTDPATTAGIPQSTTVSASAFLRVGYRF